MRWLFGNFEPQTLFLWLYGDAGAGKSSIAQTFAIQNAQQGRVLGSFFFWRDDAQRSTHLGVVATLVYQAVIAVPALRSLVSSAIELDPAIFKKHLKVQLISLLVDPINTLICTPGFNVSCIPSLIVIDGLDECSTTELQCSILKAFADALPLCGHRLRVLIASRPEVEIKAMFNSFPIMNLSTRIALDASFKPDSDIRKYLVDAFETIKSTHLLGVYIPASWPGGDVIQKLVARSSGQFIFASTIGKYIADPEQRPTEQLDVIMAIRPIPVDANMPYTEVNALYTHVLSSVPPHKIEMALNILLLVAVIPLSIRALVPFATFLSKNSKHVPPSLLSLLQLNRGDPEFYLAKVSSLVTIHNYGNDKDLPDIRISHASLSDFLLDPLRSQEFYRSPQSIFVKVAGICLERLTFIAKGLLQFIHRALYCS